MPVGHERKFGPEITPPYSSPQPCRVNDPGSLATEGLQVDPPQAAAERSRQGHHVAASLRTVIKGRAITYGTSSPRLP